MKGSFRSGSLTLSAHLAVPAGSDGQRGRPAVVLCHGFPTGPLDARRSAGTYPQLVDRIAVFRDTRLVETDTTESVLRHPRSAYTRSLIDAHLGIEG